MVTVRVFLNNPCGPTWQQIQEILPRLGQKYQIEIETFHKSREEYHSSEYKSSGLPLAPAVIVEEELIHQGPGFSEEKLASAIERHLGLQEGKNSTEGGNHA